jgi:hypothetical protein
MSHFDTVIFTRNVYATYLLTVFFKSVKNLYLWKMLAEQMLMDALIRHASIRTMAIPPSIYVGKTNQEFVLQVYIYSIQLPEVAPKWQL